MRSLAKVNPKNEQYHVEPIHVDYNKSSTQLTDTEDHAVY